LKKFSNEGNGTKEEELSMMNPREIDVLNVLWGAGEPMTATEIVDADNSVGLTQSTVIAVLRKLLEAGLVEACGITHSGKVMSRQYQPTPKSKELLLENFLNEYRMFMKVISIDEMKDALDSLRDI